MTEATIDHLSVDAPTNNVIRRSKSRKRANLPLPPKCDVSASAGICGEGDGHDKTDAPSVSAVSLLRSLQRRRVVVVRAMNIIGNRSAAAVRSAMGWQVMLPEKERAAITKRAAKFVKTAKDHVAKHGPLSPPPFESAEDLATWEDVGLFVVASTAAAEQYEPMRAAIEKKMEETAASLPVASWVNGIRGFGIPGLAVIVGEAGNLSDYANPGKLWKRLGLAPASCYRMATKDGGEANAIPRRRRSAIWTLGDSLLKQSKDNPYRELYLTYKAAQRQQHPELSDMHTHRRAQRYMEKRLLRDLWRAWRGQKGEPINAAGMPSS